MSTGGDTSAIVTPSGDELRKYFDSVRVLDGELVSDAERA
jgi:hypothetical protein